MTAGDGARSALPRERLLEFFREMLVIRRFEEKVVERFRAGELAGFLHACIGQGPSPSAFVTHSATGT